MFAFFIFFLGSVIGSFLNCLIYRLPRNLSLSHPKRSFCPKCKRLLPWFENLPILSWLLLKGRCAGCRAPISMRYPFVEIATAFLFWLCYIQWSLPMAAVGWIFVALLITATFIDLEHLLIPDEITLGGIFLGVGSSFFLPQLMGVHSHLLALAYSLTSSTVAYLMLWAILELGKKVFGKKKIRFQEPQAFELLQSGNDFFFRLGEELLPLEELFSRPSDRIVAKATWLEIANRKYSEQTLTITPKGVSISAPILHADRNEEAAKPGGARQANILTQGCMSNCPSQNVSLTQHPSVFPDSAVDQHEISGLDLEKSWPWEEATPAHGRIMQITFPREAMGFGDVKFLACIAAFLGVKGALFSLFGGSIIGAITGCIILIATRGRLGRTLPFGPYLALGALVWFFRVLF